MNNFTNILAIDTSLDKPFICLKVKDKVFNSFLEERKTSESIAVLTLSLLKEAKIKISDLSLLVCTQGPGSFTGLRIGMSFLKGLSVSLNIPLVSVSSLKLLKENFISHSINAKDSTDYSTYALVSVIKSTPNRAYYEINTGAEAELSTVISEIKALNKNTVILTNNLDYLEKSQVFIKEFADLKSSSNNIYKISECSNLGEDLINLGIKTYEERGEDKMTDGPVYLRESEAERTRKENLYLETLPKYDVIIIGGGPAGLSCGGYSSRAGLKTLIIEETSVGGQLCIIDKIENYPGMKEVSGYELAMYFSEQAENFGCEITYNKVSKIQKYRENVFKITCSDNKEYVCKATVIATGAKHKMLGVVGEKELTGHGVSYCATCDGPFFKNKKILVCGGGDSAIQEALYLSALTDDLTVCHRRDTFRAQKALVDKLNATNKCKFKMSQQIVSINGEDNKVKSVTFKDGDKTYTEDFSAVFIFIGSTPNTDFIDVEKTEDKYIKTDVNMETSVKGIFAIGDARDTNFRQIVTSASDGAICAHIIKEKL